jgi:hypothetical protein
VQKDDRIALPDIHIADLAVEHSDPPPGEGIVRTDRIDLIVHPSAPLVFAAGK